MAKKIMVWNTVKDELLCREILLFEPYKFKARTIEKSNAWKSIAENLNSLDGFKVEARSVRERYDVIKSHFLAKQRNEIKASGINPEHTVLDVALEDLIEKEREYIKTFEENVEKNKADQELARSIRLEAVETFNETRLRKEGNDDEDLRTVSGPSAKKRSRSSGSETLAYLKEKIEKETALKEQELELRKRELELQEKRLQNSQERQNQILTNLIAQNNQFLSVLDNITNKRD